MLRLFTRSAFPVKNTSAPLIFRPTFTPAIRTMATGRADNHDLKATDLFDVSHVTALVTGGATGIGLMITQALVANGAKVWITGRREETLNKTVEKYNTGAGSLQSITGDVSTKDGCLRLAEEMKEKEPKGIQLLVNNAGVARDDDTKFSSNGEPDMSSAEAISKHFLRSDGQQWTDTFTTNVSAQFFMSMAFLPLLATGGQSTPGFSSSVVNVSSISGAMKGSSMGQFSYASSKAASTHLSRMLATTFKDVKVRVNVIAPGVFPSEMTAGESGEDNKSELDMRSYNPAGRKGMDTDMAATILFLAGKGGVFYNEQILYPDGGNTLTAPSQK
ncbi:short chain dehydrogenase/reductase like protein [Zymoseptoria brevis]|uniref:Short chain dehydrogenase/reductase like protein n=1 Tax=Zymoseptoria brevis TaxID=1047168 RepID=A0A0F4GC04_9PEZI|nr:short chain dehydrogenase/reductase like protein [Zymoseptoria brevis]